MTGSRDGTEFDLAAARRKYLHLAAWCRFMQSDPRYVELEMQRAVEDGAPWAIPHQNVHRLTREATEAVLGGAQPDRQPLEQRAYRGIEGGGILVARREVMLSTPMDPAFTGWG